MSETKTLGQVACEAARQTYPEWLQNLWSSEVQWDLADDERKAQWEAIAAAVVAAYEASQLPPAPEGMSDTKTRPVGYDGFEVVVPIGPNRAELVPPGSHTEES